jgi:hypothetical protein
MATKRPLVNYSGTIKELQDGDNISGATGGDVVGPSSSTDNAVVRYDGTTGKLVQDSTVKISDSGNLTDLNGITFDTTPTGAPTAEGSMYWNADLGGAAIVMAGGDVVQEIGESQYIYARASSAITKGQVIMFTGAVGASGIPTGAPATGVTDGTYIMGIAAESIALNEFGLVQTFGVLKPLDTTGLSDGAILWYNPAVTGGYTTTKPSAPNIKVQLAAVVSGGSSGGAILIRITAGSELGGTDSNVLISSPADNDVLTYDSTAGVWKNEPPSGGGGDAYVGSTNTFTANQIISVTDNSNAALRITQAGTGNALVVEDEANPDSTPFVVGNNGNVGIGIEPQSLSKLYVSDSEAWQVLKSTTSGFSSMFQLITPQGNMYVGKDRDGSSGYWGSGGEYIIAGTGNYPMDFYTNANKRVSITSAGGVSFGSSGTAYGTSGQVLTSNGNAPPSWTTISTGSGDVTGPSSATDNAIVRFDGTTGELIQDSAVTIADTTGNMTFSSNNPTIYSDVITYTANTTDTGPALNIVPTGTAKQAYLIVHNNSDTANSSQLYVNSNPSGTEFRIQSTAVGTGSFVPLSIYTSGTERLRFSVNGGFGLSGTNYGTTGQVLTSQGDAPPIWASVTGTGDVVGPSSATDNAIARFDGTTGKLIQNSAVTIADTTGNMTFSSNNPTIYSDVITYTANTTDTSTTLGIAPTGTEKRANLYVYNNSDTANSSRLLINGDGAGTAFRIQSTSVGTGTNLPLEFWTSQSVKLSIAADTTGTYTFGGTAPRITGDFSNAAATNRVMFQSNVANSFTTIEAIPNGTVQTSRFVASSNSSDPDNSSFLDLAMIGGTSARITSGIRGTGTYLPLTFQTSNTEKLRIAADTTGTYTFGGTAPRITGDFSGDTRANRVMFQTNQVNVGTSVSAIPNGTSQTSRFRAYSNSDPTNTNFIAIESYFNKAVVDSGIEGTGTYTPLALRTSGTDKLSIAADTTGTFTFSGTAPRITGDFSNTTVASRISFQTSTTNGSTLIPIFPNGTSPSSGIQCYSTPDGLNASVFAFRIGALGGQHNFDSNITGTGTLLPITFRMNNVDRLKFEADAAARINTIGAVYNPRAAANTGAFDLSVGNNFSCTPTGPITLTFSNFISGQSGLIYLPNPSGYAISKTSSMACDANCLATLSAPGNYVLAYFSGSTGVQVTYSQNVT